jgi:hypothetical protein
MDTSGREQSEFNMAVSFLNRINLLFYTANGAALDLDAHTWYHSLRCLFRELSGYMKDAELSYWQDKRSEMNNKVITNNKRVQKSGYKQIEPDLYIELEEFEMFVRKVLKDSGLQTRMVDDPSRAAVEGLE